MHKASWDGCLWLSFSKQKAYWEKVTVILLGVGVGSGECGVGWGTKLYSQQLRLQRHFKKNWLIVQNLNPK